MFTKDVNSPFGSFCGQTVSFFNQSGGLVGDYKGRGGSWVMPAATYAHSQSLVTL